MFVRNWFRSLQNKIGMNIIKDLDDVGKITTEGPWVDEAMHRTPSGGGIDVL